jgi:hypothetical protein
MTAHVMEEQTAEWRLLAPQKAAKMAGQMDVLKATLWG